MGIHEIYVGKVNITVLRAAEVFCQTIRDNVPSIIYVNNHPSDDPTPSAEDLDITRGLVSAGKLLAIDLLDHLVIGAGSRFASLNEIRLGFCRARVPVTRLIWRHFCTIS